MNATTMFFVFAAICVAVVSAWRGLDIALNVLLAIVGAWVAWETRELRRHSAEELSIARRQARMSAVPFFNTSVHPLTEALMKLGARTTFPDTSSTNYGEPLNHALDELGAMPTHERDNVSFVVAVENISDLIAHNLRAYVYVASRSRYDRSHGGGLTYIGPKSWCSFLVRKDLQPRTTIIAELECEYGAMAPSTLAMFGADKESVLFIVFETLDNQVFVYRRRFISDETFLHASAAEILPYDKAIDNPSLWKRLVYA